MSDQSQPYKRSNLRTSPEIKDLIVPTASSSGVSLIAFLIASAQERAKQVLSESECLTLSPKDSDRFFRAVSKVNKPRPKLAAADQNYLAWRNQPTKRK